MSDAQQGEGWWLASDGKWYPPAPPTGDPYRAGPPYGTPAYPPVYGSPYPPAQTSGKAIAVMVLGIVGVALMCGYGIGAIPAIVALALAPGAKREIRESGGRLQGEGQIKAGVICSWVAVGVAAVAIIAVIAIIVISATTSTSGGGTRYSS